MTDIIERLRIQYVFIGDTAYEDIINADRKDALDEIERLRAENAKTKLTLLDEISMQRDEIERLRDALTQIEGCFSSVEAAAAVTRERITDALDGYVWDDSE